VFGVVTIVLFLYSALESVCVCYSAIEIIVIIIIIIIIIIIPVGNLGTLVCIVQL